MMLIKERHRERLWEIFASVPLKYEVWAYGSRVNGEAHDGSDLDLVIRNQSLDAFPMEHLQALKQKIHDSSIPFLVDLHDWARLPLPFQQNIMQRHEVFFVQ